MRLARVAVRHPWWAALATMAAAGLGAFLIVSAGLVPIRASSRHWPITEWLLHFAMRRAVVTQSLLGPAPPGQLDAPAMVARGAAHFDLACRSCHGAPGDALPPLPRAMTPQPPPLSQRVTSWSDRQLFFIVRHGVKFTGMPAWPAATRDDEVWSMVGFLRRLPTLDPQEYQQLAGTGRASAALEPGPTPTDPVIEQCARCHDRDGGGRGGVFPRLAGQRFEYLQHAMQAYADGRRHSGTMQVAAARLSRDERDAAARFYASLPPHPTGTAVTESARRGAALADTIVIAGETPSCNSCHGADADVNRSYPRLSGQPAWYLAGQLELLKARRRGGSEFVHIMHTVVDQLTPAQIHDLASYYAAAPPR